MKFGMCLLKVGMFDVRVLILGELCFVVVVVGSCCIDVFLCIFVGLIEIVEKVCLEVFY